ncbi:BlaI/MecI/CopY family transcriptional regulator [Antrihabitans sp. YC3-6]|uniref:BlaI/MecI/CopY family transcriptional regulator n=1 Tax=Antrihabitans stalagmiti TaxID=2799499 RepID=A0A934U1X9_9NOCA|nr:BlaI/MecI/CopY family transcriptional regulator [Antrihabitans stalagmiti]MBJ8338521.1 BlaI/MecI/CopY family transcriptional regulator [Antrihabitans stalagmiti]
MPKRETTPITVLGGAKRRPERRFTRKKQLGDLEKLVMDYLWSVNTPTTVRQVHEAISLHRSLAYTTVMTVMNRLARKDLLTQHRDSRAHRFSPTQAQSELVANMMVDALHEAPEPNGRSTALMRFVGKVGVDELATLRRTLAELDDATLRGRSA